MASTEDVSMLRDIIGYQLDEADCKRLLQISNNDLGQAASKFFDTDAENLKSQLQNSIGKWDETAFGGAMYGQDPTMPTFSIDYAQGVESYPHSTVHSQAPTRPPSRSSQRSILSTHAGDAPIQSIESMQESGLIGNSRQAFGPATKEAYDDSQWALVPTATEVIADSVPSQRKREQGEPAILKPSPNFNYLPALISILHSIPLYRNALLTPSVTNHDYWMGGDWWKGSASPPARIIDRSIGLAEAQKRDIIYETQRLMAFLDDSDRIYGSVGALLDSDAWREWQGEMSDPDDDILKFLLTWSEAYEMLTPDADLKGLLKTVFAVNGENQNTFLLDGTVTRNSTRPRLDIYDVLDEALFSSGNASAHITDIGHVLVLRLTSSTTDAADLGCRVPATLFADRYLADNKHIIESMYRSVKQYEDQFANITSQIETLKWHSSKKEGAKRIESLKLLKTSMTAFEAPADGSEPDPKDVDILTKLQQLTHSIEAKLKALDAEAQSIQQAIQQVSGHFKPIIDDGTEPPIDLTTDDLAPLPPGQAPADAMKHPYSLVGVATRRDVVYLLHPASTAPFPSKHQWWRMQYDTESANPTIRRDPQTTEEVLERATSESASVLLVFASDYALSVPSIPLTEPLREFVRRDNLGFMEELQRMSSTGWEGYDEQYAHEPQGDWQKESLTDWENIDTKRFRDDPAMENSDATLTPNTDMEGSAGVREMVEINGGMDVAMGLDDSDVLPSEDLALSERMEIDIESQVKSLNGDAKSLVHKMDVDEPTIQHVEFAAKKGG